MKTTVKILTLGLLASANIAGAQASRSVAPNASEIMISLANDSKRLRAEFRAIMLGSDPLLKADVIKGTFKLKVDKQMSAVTNRKTVITVLPSTSIDGFSLDPASNFLAKLLQGDGGASGPEFFGFEALQYPDIGTLAGITVADWRALPAYTRPAATIDRTISWCQGELADKTRKFWFEVLPLHLHCRTISLLNLEAYKTALGVLNAPPTMVEIPTYSTYNIQRDGLNIELATGAAILAAEKYIESKSGDHPGAAGDSPAFSTASEFVRNKARCFPIDGKPYIKTILGSFLMPFDQTIAMVGATNTTTVKIKAPQAVAHPEPGYAIGTYARYNVNDDAHNLNIVANNFLNQDPQNIVSTTAAIDYSTLISGYDATSGVPVPSVEKSSILMDNATYKSFTFNGEGVLHFNFNVRDIHGSGSSPTCTFYCAEPKQRRTPANFIDRVSTDITRDAWFRPGS